MFHSREGVGGGGVLQYLSDLRMLPLIDPFLARESALLGEFVIGSTFAPYVSSFSCFDVQIST